MYYSVGTINGYMRKLLSSVISHMAELMAGSWDMKTGIKLYDRLSESQKLIGLYIIGKAWFSEEINIQCPTLLHDAIIGAILQECKDNVEVEIDTEKEDPKNPYKYYWRSKIIKAAKEELKRLKEDDPDYEDYIIPMKFDEGLIAKQMKERKEEELPIIETLEMAIYEMNKEYNPQDYKK